MQFSLCLLKCPWLCAGSNVQIPGEVVILNSVVLPDKELYASYKNQIILWPLDVAYSAYKDVIKTGGLMGRLHCMTSLLCLWSLPIDHRVYTVHPDWVLHAGVVEKYLLRFTFL